MVIIQSLSTKSLLCPTTTAITLTFRCTASPVPQHRVPPRRGRRLLLRAHRRAGLPARGATASSPGTARGATTRTPVFKRGSPCQGWERHPAQLPRRRRPTGGSPRRSPSAADTKGSFPSQARSAGGPPAGGGSALPQAQGRRRVAAARRTPNPAADRTLRGEGGGRRPTRPGPTAVRGAPKPRAAPGPPGGGPGPGSARPPALPPAPSPRSLPPPPPTIARRRRRGLWRPAAPARRPLLPLGAARGCPARRPPSQPHPPRAPPPRHHPATRPRGAARRRHATAPLPRHVTEEPPPRDAGGGGSEETKRGCDAHARRRAVIDSGGRPGGAAPVTLSGAGTASRLSLLPSCAVTPQP